MPQSLTRADVERIAALARLQLTGDEANVFAVQLTEILAYAEQVQAVDTSGVSAPESAGASRAVRVDEPRSSFDRTQLLSQAPAADPTTGLFKVPRVIGS
jgi:aspartyl-tRNA(Asn)/glutamyl-tRNA(Gln) amidotransferase subunit C